MRNLSFIFFRFARYGRLLWNKLRQLKKPSSKSKPEQQQTNVKAANPEITILKQKMMQTVTALKSSAAGVKRYGNAKLYTRPWYIIIGGEECGKTTLLNNFDLRFSFANADLQPKTGSTQNCDLSIAHQAVIIDTAARYIKDGKQKDEWLALLQLIKKARLRLPLNGIIIVVSLAKDLDQEYAKTLRDRIDDIYRLGFFIPITLVFTKADSIPGFNEYFAQTPRDQLWGINMAEDFNTQFQQLQQKLLDLRVTKIPSADAEKNFKIYNFPQQFEHKLKQIKSFIEALQQQNYYQKTPMLCGTYFTAAADGYFTKDIFSKAVLPYKNTNRKTKARKRLQQLFNAGSIIVCGGILFLIFMLFCHALNKNITLLQQGKETASQLAYDNSMPRLVETYKFYTLNENKNIPFHSRLGLFRGNRELEPLQQMLTYTIQSRFLPFMGKLLTRKLTYYHTTWANASTNAREQIRGKYYATLKAYLMLSFPERINNEQATALFSHYWQQTSSTKLAPQAYKGLVELYLQRPNPWHADSQLVARVRSQLRLKDNAPNLYSEISNILSLQLPPMKLPNLLTSNYKLSSIYTRKTWHATVKPEINKVAITAYEYDWVMDTPLSQLAINPKIENTNAILVNNLKKELEQLYFTDYRNAWIELLSQAKIKRFSSLTDAKKKLKILARHKSPIIKLINLASDNANISELEQPLLKLHIKLGLISYLSAINKVKKDIQTLNISSDPAHAAEQYSGQILAGGGTDTYLYKSMLAANKLADDIDDDTTREATKQLLQQPTCAIWETVLHTASKDLQRQWQMQVYNTYQQTIATKFPFASGGADAAIQDTSMLLHPSRGQLWQFINSTFKNFLTYTNHWQKQTWLGIGMDFKPRFLTDLNLAKATSDEIFSSNQAGLAYQIYPYPTPGISHINFTVNGKSYRYNNGPQEWEHLHWNINAPQQNSLLSAATSHGRNPNSIQSSGPWSLFHVLKHGKLTHTHGNTYKISWPLKSSAKTYHINMLLRTANENNIFAALLLNNFALPEQIFENHQEKHHD